MEALFIEKAKILKSNHAHCVIGISSNTKIDEILTEASQKSGVPKSLIADAAILSFLKNESNADEICQKQIEYINFLINEKKQKTILIKEIKDSGVITGRVPGHIKNILMAAGYREKVIKPTSLGGKKSYRAYVLHK